jgi:hypothetical protein
MVSEFTLKWGLHTLNVAYNREASKDVEALFRQALTDLSDEAFKAGVAAVVKTERFFPSPAVVLEAARAWMSDQQREVFTPLPPADYRREETTRGMDVFKRELKNHGIDVDELVAHHSWRTARIPGEEG